MKKSARDTRFGASKALYGTRAAPLNDRGKSEALGAQELIWHF